MIGEEEKEEVKDAVEDEPKVEDTPQEEEETSDEESEDDEQLEDEEQQDEGNKIILYFSEYFNLINCTFNQNITLCFKTFPKSKNM